MIPILEPPISRWYCPNCGLRDATREARPHTRFHICPKLRGLTAPMLPEGTAAKVEAREREDYVGQEDVQTDEDGRPVMSIVTTRDDGQDVVVFAPTAHGRSD
jgi:predicted RNA-binding Zn-ribbon protein involved in translation (DUF1610 family)